MMSLSVSWSADSSKVVSGSEDATVRIWNALTGTGSLQRTLDRT